MSTIYDQGCFAAQPPNNDEPSAIAGSHEQSSNVVPTVLFQHPDADDGLLGGEGVGKTLRTRTTLEARLSSLIRSSTHERSSLPSAHVWISKLRRPDACKLASRTSDTTLPGSTQNHIRNRGVIQERNRVLRFLHAPYVKTGFAKSYRRFPKSTS